MFYPSSQCQCSHKWSGSSHPCRWHYSCMGSCRTAWCWGGSRKTWLLQHSVPLPTAGCSCFVHRWTSLEYSRHSHSSALLSRALWEGWVLPGSQAGHRGTCRLPDQGSHSHHWQWMGCVCCSLILYLNEEDKETLPLSLTHSVQLFFFSNNWVRFKVHCRKMKIPPYPNALLTETVSATHHTAPFPLEPQAMNSSTQWLIIMSVSQLA